MKIANIVITLGTFDEIRELNFPLIGWDAKFALEWLHNIAYVHLMQFNIMDVTAWSNRTANVFMMNNLVTVGNVVNLPLKNVDWLPNCGKVVKREVFNVFRNKLGMTLEQWNPDIYIGRRAYKEDLNGDGG